LRFVGYKVIKKIPDYSGVDEFNRDKPPPKRLSVADTFDEYACDDYINADYTDF